MVDPLASWWRHEVSVARYTGVGAYGDQFATPVPYTGTVEDSRRLVRGPDGEQLTSSTTVRLPIDTPDIPLGSIVFLPAFGGRAATVLAVSRHHGGGQPTPDHLELALT